jgi:peptidoglycan/xylan/chitin deacetylase (PgdA/CDA1 family)
VTGAILMYHRVSNAEPTSELCLAAEHLRRHLGILQSRGCEVVPLREMQRAVAAGSSDRPIVALTFDDGYDEMLSVVAPMLAEHGLPATCFVVGETLDGPVEFWWDALRRVFAAGSLPARLVIDLPSAALDLPTESAQEKRVAHHRLAEAFYPLPKAAREAALRTLFGWSGAASVPGTGHRPLTATEVAQLSRLPGMEIGAHSDSHVWLPGLTRSDRRREIEDSKARLEALLDSSVVSFAYPYGCASGDTVDAVRNAGLELAVTTETRGVRRGDDPLLLPRLDAGGCDPDAFERLLDVAFARAAGFSPRPRGHRTLVTGWFSFADGHATAGDLLARDMACDWLCQAGEPFDVAIDAAYGAGLDWRTVDPRRYHQLVFVCGPFGRSDDMEIDLLRRFADCRTIGLNLSMIDPLEDWNPFDTLLERDSGRTTSPDIVFASCRPLVPVVGICLVEPHDGADTVTAEAAIERLMAAEDLAALRIDTRLDVNAAGLRTPAQIEALLARVDMVITTRLHGLVLALKNGVPVIAIDPVIGGGKISRQGREIDWPVTFGVANLTDAGLRGALSFCLSDEARRRARACARDASNRVVAIRERFIESVRAPFDALDGAR